MKKIFDYLDELYDDPKPELNYTNDFEFLIAIVLSAQSTDKKVNKVTSILFSKYNIDTLSKANREDIELILKPLGMSKKKSKYIIDISKEIASNDRKIPRDRDSLMKLSGVGRKTANVFLSHLFNMPYIAVDTHVSRVSKRLGLVNEEDDVLTIENKLYKLVPKDRCLKTHIQFVLFGRYICKAIKPKCDICKLKEQCLYYKKTS